MSITEFLEPRNSAQWLVDSGAEPPLTFESADAYVVSVKTKIDTGCLNIAGNPIVKPADPLAMLDNAQSLRCNVNATSPTAEDIWELASRPTVYAWVPEKLFPGVVMKCSTCQSTVTSARWARDKTLHGLSVHQVYLTKEYTCCNCVAKPRREQAAASLEDVGSDRKRARKQFQADAPMALALLPEHVQASWKFVQTGRILCEAGVVDLVRALATRTSWSAIADTINELKEMAWAREVASTFATLCTYFDVCPTAELCGFPQQNRLSADWVRNVYVADAQKRHTCVRQELSEERGDDILALDWTVDAASRCSADFLFNAMDGRRRILMSSLTPTSSPYGVQPLLAALRERGVAPKVVYVDCECCGAWRSIVRDIWPTAVVKRDAMHAIRRLTKTVSSTQHPLHGRFCAALAGAIYTYDAESMARFSEACRRETKPGVRPCRAKSRYVPRVIVDALRIARAIGSVLATFQDAPSPADPLLTQGTMDAWRDLQPHVAAGCLCDPPGVQLHEHGEGVVIGGRRFKPIRTLRGASALEGFHSHQKQWLGCLARHAADAGVALLADGAVRWNRKRRRQREDELVATGA